MKDGSYKGITRKVITVPVQRLVLIYSKEEQIADRVEEQPDNDDRLAHSPHLSEVHTHSSHSQHNVPRSAHTSGMIRSMMFSVHQYEDRLCK